MGRPFQLLLIGVKHLLRFIAGSIPATWVTCIWILDSVTVGVLDHNVILALTTVFPTQGLLPLLLDGPRSSFGYHLLSLKDGDQEEMFGSTIPSSIETILWRFRYVFYIGLRAIVTTGW